MSADADQGTTAVDNGPTIITVIGQEGHVPAGEVVNEVKTPETNTEAVEVKKEAAGSEEQVEHEERDAKGRFKTDAKTRISQLTAARHEAERKAQYWEDVATGKIVPPAAPAPAAATKANEQPVRDQFGSEEEYLDALTDYKVEKKLAARDQQARVTQETTEKATSWQSKLQAARTDIPDFDEVMNNAEIHVEGHVAGLMMEHPQGAKVAHHLAVNPEKLDEINAMDAAQAAFAIAEIAGQFKPSEATSSSKPAAAVKKVSEAPPPAARNVGSGRSTTVPLGEMSMEDYVAARKAQGAGWAR